MFSSRIVMEGYHGTSIHGARSIENSSYEIKPSPEDWMGEGAYFFIKGISCPNENALEWAVNKYGDNAGVVKSIIMASAERILDLTNINGLRRYNVARDEYISKNVDCLKYRRDLSIKKRKDIRLDDKIVTEAVLNKLNIDIVIHNLYIKNAVQRKLILESSYPNTTVCNVRNLHCIKESEVIYVG